MEAVRMLKANMKLDGKPCGWCQAILRLGDDAAVCTACEREHHAGCWQSQAGCATQGCANAPLRRLDAPGQAGYPQGGGSPYPPGPGSPFPQGGAPYAAGPGSPFPQGGAAFAQAGLPPGYTSCPSCRSAIILGAHICPVCRAITSPDGLYAGPKINAPGAVSALVFGILGVCLCGLLGIGAIIQANNAKRAMASDPTLGGAGMATAGLVLGIIGLALFGLFSLGTLIGMSHR